MRTAPPLTVLWWTLLAIVIAAAALLSPGLARSQVPVPTSVEGWILPFDNSDDGGYGMLISNAPGVGRLAVNGTGLDIDFAPLTAGVSVPARAPADGVVLDIFLDGEPDGGRFGNKLRIDHRGVASLFAHLDSISVSPGEFVKQGQIVGAIGNTGAGGLHLHFGAQAGAVQDVRRSGTDLPLFEIPGTWFYPCYSPPSNLGQ